MKYEWKKQEKELYSAKTKPSLVVVPKQNFIMISGEGNPNDMDFSNRVSALFTLAYRIKMNYKATTKSNSIEEEITDYSVYPLEGIWKLKNNSEFSKDNLEYTIMIQQPDFIDPEMVTTALEQVKVKKPNPLYDEIKFDTLEDEKCVQILHKGSYNNEPGSFEKMNALLQEKGLKRSGNWHREIYLNNANRTKEENLKTILRYPIK